jgi:hypothetical protein
MVAAERDGDWLAFPVYTRREVTDKTHSRPVHETIPAAELSRHAALFSVQPETSESRQERGLRHCAADFRTRNGTNPATNTLLKLLLDQTPSHPVKVVAPTPE